MTTLILLLFTLSSLGALAYAQYYSPRHRRPVRTLAKETLNNSTALQNLPAATNPEQASHNLEYSDQHQQSTENCPPTRNVLDADFAAEAHGFTGFESVGKGSRYKSSW